jgi:hypothetical protein
MSSSVRSLASNDAGTQAWDFGLLRARVGEVRLAGAGYTANAEDEGRMVSESQPSCSASPHEGSVTRQLLEESTSGRAERAKSGEVVEHQPDELPSTELRVHGVSGTPPTANDMLGRHDVTCVAGDRTAGFYRRAIAEPSSTGTVLEAYSWGNLTSGGASRALWLLLLPFTLVNVAFWMRPGPDGPPAREKLDGAAQSLIRLFAVSLTSTLVLGAVGMSVDLAGWQCAGPGRSCGAGHSFLSFMNAGWWSQPGRRMLVTAVVPVAVIALLWFLGRQTWKAYESVQPGGSPGRRDARLAEPDYWNGENLVGRLRALHVASALATLGAMLVWPALLFDGTRVGRRAAIGASAFGACLVILLAVAVVIVLPAAGRRAATRSLPDRVAVPALAAAIVALALALGYLVLPRPAWTAQGPLPGYESVIRWLFVGQAAGLAGLALVLAVLHRGLRGPAPVMRGQAATVFGGLGLLLAGVFAAGVAFRVADWLDGRDSPIRVAGSTGGTLITPRPYDWASLAFLTIALVVAGFLVWVVLVWLRQQAKREEATVCADYADRARQPLDPKRLRQVSRARASAAATDRVGSWLGGLFAVGAVIAVPVFIVIINGKTPAQVFGLTDNLGTIGWVTNVANWAVSLFALALIALGRQAYRSQQSRRLIGILWDVGTFWPRAAHPLAPPCYAERSVPDLTCRIDYLARANGASDGVVIAAHSQGTVLAAAAILQLPTDSVSGVSLLTFGSPLARLYGRYFPTYFGPAQLDSVRTALGPGRWRNLYRPTDPIGGCVFDEEEEVDRRLPHDPWFFDRQPGQPTPDAIRGHSDYQRDPAYAEETRRLRPRRAVSRVPGIPNAAV